MRIWFGLILKITARMKSYILLKLRYFDKINWLMREITILFGALPSCWYSTENSQKDVAFFFFVFGRASPEFEKWVNSREAVH